MALGLSDRGDCVHSFRAAMANKAQAQAQAQAEALKLDPNVSG